MHHFMIDSICQKAGAIQDFLYEYSLVSEMESLGPSLVFRLLKIWYADSTARIHRFAHNALKL